MKKSTKIALLSTIMPMLVGAAQFSLDLRPTEESVRLPKKALLGSEIGVLRKTQLGMGAAAVKGLAVGDVLELQLYDDGAMELSLVGREESPLTGAAFQAKVAGAKLRNAVVTESEAGLQINIQDETSGRVYTVASAEDGVTIKEIDPNAEATCCAGVRIPETTKILSKSLTAVSSTAPMLAATGDQSSTLVDMLVAYDTPAATWAKSNAGGITNLAQQCVAKMNTALANNGLDTAFRFRLVGVIAVDADGGSDFDGTLDNVTDGIGAWAAIKAMRETVGADVVSTMIDTGSAYNTTGLGWSMSYTDPSDMAYFKNHAYNVISVRAAAQSHVMTHETGHNMGAGHSDQQASGPGPQSYDYSSGYYFTGSDSKNYHTIMAYNSDGYGGSYDSAPLFSDPDNTWAGVAAGDATHDNAQVLANTYQAVSQFRAQQIAMSYDVFFSPEAGSLFSDSITVTLTPGKAGLTIRYTIDGSTPTATYGSIYSAPLTLTKTTTIKAVTITDGIAGPVYEASYYISDLGSALNAPQLVWQTDSDNPWFVETDDTYDGSLAVQSAALPKGPTGTTWLSTTVTGPTKMSFRYHAKMWSSNFYVYIDSAKVLNIEDETDEWTLAEVDIPAGSHTVKFEYYQWGYYYDPTVCGVWLDDVRFDALSRPPTMTPTTTSAESTAATFNGTLTVTLAPTVVGGKVFYTLDGSDPAGEDGIEYSGPITLTKSTLVRAVEADPGKDVSAEVKGFYLERHTVTAGEWTTDVEGAKSEAKKNGKLICVLCANYATCSYCRAFDPIAQSKTFCNWAKENGVYLITSDSSVNLDAEAAHDYFWDLYNSSGDSGGIYYPTMYFALASTPDTPVAKGVGRNSGSFTIGTVTYDGTVEKLVEGVASVLSAQGFSPTALSPIDPADILGTTGVTWNNSSTVAWRELYPGKMKAGGLMKTNFTSTLTATVSGKGKFIFTYEDRSWYSSNVNSFSWTGGDGFSHKQNYSGSSGTITNLVTSSGGATFTFTCTIGSYEYDYDDNYVDPCGFTIYDVKWIPEGSEITTTTEVPVPFDWLATYYPSAASSTYETLAASTGANGYSVWESYVAGLDPTDATSKFKAIITFENGEPVITYEPELSAAEAALRTYTTLGKPSLNATTWTPVTEVNKSSMKFFKVKVELSK